MFDERLPNHSKLFIPFIMAGDPSEEFSINLALTLEKCGASILELGVPYSDPLADGPIIQRSAQRALQQGMNLEKAVNLVGKMREKGVNIPIIIFTYYNPVLQLGYERFSVLAKQNGVDGLLIPDLPFEESESVRTYCHLNGLRYISLVAPTSQDRISKISHSAEGFLYCVSSLGVTGVRNDLSPTVKYFLEDVRKVSNIPVVVGFGISNDRQVRELIPYCDGVVIGSAIIRMIEEFAPISDKDLVLRKIQIEVEKILSPMLLER